MSARRRYVIQRDPGGSFRLLDTDKAPVMEVCRIACPDVLAPQPRVGAPRDDEHDHILDVEARASYICEMLNRDVEERWIEMRKALLESRSRKQP